MQVCRVCLGMHVRMYHMSEHGLSAVYARVVGVQINAEDKLPRQLCWECAARLSSANHFIEKALKTQRILSLKMNNSRVITASDISSIDKAQHKLGSTLGTKLYGVNEYDFLFTEETIEPNNCCNISISVSVNNNKNEDITETEPNFKKEKLIFIKEEFKSEEDPIKTELEDLNKEPGDDVVKEEAHSTTVYKNSVIDNEETNNDNAYISNDDLAVSIKKEHTSVEVVSGDRESFSWMSQEGRQVVDKSSEVCEDIKKIPGKRNNNLSPLRNKRSKLLPDCKELRILAVEDIFQRGDSYRQHTPVSKALRSTDTKATKYETITTKNMDVNDSYNSSPTSAGTSNVNIVSNLKVDDTESLDKLICDIYNKPLHRKPSLIQDIQNHSRDYNCIYCTYKSHRKSDVKKHINSQHTKSTSYDCSYCSYKGYQKSHLNEHISSQHTKSNSYNCSYCSFKTYNKSNLSKHNNSKHTKSTSYDCFYCSYKSYDKSNLRKHVNYKHTKKTTYDCSYCSYKAYQKCHLNEHINSLHTKSVSYD